MPNHFWSFAGVVLLMFLVLLVGQVLGAGVDWTSEVGAAWLQFAASVLTVGVTVYFALHAKRVADTAEERARRYEVAAAKEREEREREVLNAGIWICDAAIEAVTEAIRAHDPRTPNADAATVFAAKNTVGKFVIVVDQLLKSTNDAPLMTALSELTMALRLPEIADGRGVLPGNGPELLRRAAISISLARELFEELADQHHVADLR